MTERKFSEAEIEELGQWLSTALDPIFNQLARLSKAVGELFELLRPWFDAIVKFYNDLGACLMDVLRDPHVQEQIRSNPELAEFQALID